MTTALVSLLTGRPVRPEVGMTGEITLQGKVLPIGGVKQKVLAAHRAGLTEVVLPARNEADLEDVPEAVRERDDLPSGRRDRGSPRTGPEARSPCAAREFSACIGLKALVVQGKCLTCSRKTSCISGNFPNNARRWR